MHKTTGFIRTHECCLCEFNHYLVWPCDKQCCTNLSGVLWPVHNNRVIKLYAQSSWFWTFLRFKHHDEWHMHQTQLEIGTPCTATLLSLDSIFDLLWTSWLLPLGGLSVRMTLASWYFHICVCKLIVWRISPPGYDLSCSIWAMCANSILYRQLRILTITIIYNSDISNHWV